MVIDTDDLKNQLVLQAVRAMDAFQHLNLLHIGIGLVGVGTTLACIQLYRDWKKKKGYRMAVRERTSKEKELLEQIINDGLFEAELAGKISEQRMNALYQFCSDKLDLPDLIPKERRLKIVKEQIKARLVKSKKLVPAEFYNTKFSETIGKFNFWTKKSA